MTYLTLSQAFKTAVRELQGAAVPSDLVMRYVNDICALVEPATNKVIDLSGLIIQGAVDWSQRDDLPELNCDGTVFMDDLNCKNIYFQNSASFINARFEKDVDFFCAFGAKNVLINFSSAVFIGFADFEGSIRGYFEYDNAQFLGDYDFDG